MASHSNCSSSRIIDAKKVLNRLVNALGDASVQGLSISVDADESGKSILSDNAKDGIERAKMHRNIKLKATHKSDKVFESCTFEIVDEF